MLFPVLCSRILLFIHLTYNSLHLLIPNSLSSFLHRGLSYRVDQKLNFLREHLRPSTNFPSPTFFPVFILFTFCKYKSTSVHSGP